MTSQQENYYRQHYWNVHYKGLMGKFTNGYHRRLERIHNPQHLFSNVLEIGGGTGEHLAFVSHDFASYTILDIVENLEGLQRVKLDPRESRIRFILADAANVPLLENSCDRILVTCVLHHIPNLEKALAEIRRIAEPNATVDFYVPCDPGAVYRWIRHWTSHFKQKKAMNLSWKEVKYLWAIEHRNHYLGIISLIKGIYSKDAISIERFPLRLFSWNFNLYSIVRIQIKK